MRELEGTIGLERIDAHKLRERIALLEGIAQKQRALLNHYDLAPDGYKMLCDLHSVILQEDKPNE
jgi:hypothetical protein